MMCTQVSKARWKLRCQLCRQPHGACIQCAGSGSCFAAFHPLCARSAGLHMAALDLSRLESVVGNLPPLSPCTGHGGPHQCHDPLALIYAHGEPVVLQNASLRDMYLTSCCALDAAA